MLDGVCWRVVLACMFYGWGKLEVGTRVYVGWGVLEGGTRVYVGWGVLPRCKTLTEFPLALCDAYLMQKNLQNLKRM